MPSQEQIRINDLETQLKEQKEQKNYFHRLQISLKKELVDQKRHYEEQLKFKEEEMMEQEKQQELT